MNIGEQTQALSSIPLGLMAMASNYRGASSILQGVVLEQMVEFDPSQYVQARRAAFDVVAIVGPKMPMLSFVLYIEDARLHWLADPTEPSVWSAIDAWNRQGAVSVALSREETHTFIIPLRGKLGKEINHLRKLCGHDARDTFVSQAIEMFDLGILNGFDHPNAPSLTHKGWCLLHTRNVDKALKRLGYEIAYPANGSKAPIFCARREAQSGRRL